MEDLNKTIRVHIKKTHIDKMAKAGGIGDRSLKAKLGQILNPSGVTVPVITETALGNKLTFELDPNEPVQTMVDRERPRWMVAPNLEDGTEIRDWFKIKDIQFHLIKMHSNDLEVLVTTPAEVDRWDGRKVKDVGGYRLRDHCRHCQRDHPSHLCHIPRHQEDSDWQKVADERLVFNFSSADIARIKKLVRSYVERKNGLTQAEARGCQTLRIKPCGNGPKRKKEHNDPKNHCRSDNTQRRAIRSINCDSTTTENFQKPIPANIKTRFNGKNWDTETISEDIAALAFVDDTNSVADNWKELEKQAKLLYEFQEGNAAQGPSGTRDSGSDSGPIPGPIRTPNRIRIGLRAIRSLLGPTWGSNRNAY
ncbi:hypothetical protein BDR26DRAFT_944115 [Obelidium mucronatum]|nr:hypothetical protein BDR26DRAFT_944115 [Obelidium mucronatum]